jgi:hypothetical protein
VCHAGAVTLLANRKLETKLACTCTPETTTMFDYIVKCTPIIISLVVAGIGFRQWRLSEEKVRSDMYARRFSVYENTLSFYYAVMKGGDLTTAAEVLSAQLSFLKSWRESAFLFRKEDGISEILDAFRLETNPFVDQKRGLPVTKEINVLRLEDHLMALEAKLWPYIDMTKLGAPKHR